MAEMFPLSDEESSAVPDDGCSVTCDLENDTKKGTPLYLYSVIFLYLPTIY